MVAERGGEEVLMSLPLDGGRGGEAVDGPRPPERLSMLGEELTVLELWPERGTGGGGYSVNAMCSDLLAWLSDQYV